MDSNDCFPHDPAPEPRVGRFIFKQTKQVQLFSPLAAVSGKYKQAGVFCERQSGTYFREYVVPRDPRSPSQLSWRDRFTLAQQTWPEVPAADREAWQDYGGRHWMTDESQVGNVGQNAFLKVHTYRLGRGDGFMMSAPHDGPPPAPDGFEEIGLPDPASLALRVHHSVADYEGSFVLLEMTPATATPNRTPHENDLRWAGTDNPGSFLPLSADGDLYYLPQVRFTIEPGRRFAVRIRLISPEGVPGPALMKELRR